MDFKNTILRNKMFLIGLKIRTGNKVWEFAGAGNSNLMFRLSVSGLDVTQNSSGKFWVEYKNVNPAIKKALLAELDRIKKIMNDINGTNEVKNVSIKEEYQKNKGESVSKAKELGFTPANEIQLY